MNKRVIVVGLGRFGSALAESLGDHGWEVIAVDAVMDPVDAVKQRVAFAVQLDATDPRALRSIDCHTCTTGIIAIGENFEAAVLCVNALREAGVAHVVARARTERQARILTAVGASEVIEIEAEMGRTLGRRLVAGAVSPATAPTIKR